MKLSVGYPCYPSLSFYHTIAPYIDQIGELYFAWEGFASGRTDFASDPTEKRQLLEADLLRFHQQGIHLNLLLNGNCYGENAISTVFARQIIQTVADLRERFGLDIVTTASPYVARVLKKQFPEIEVRASVNMWVDGIFGMEQCAADFDAFYLKRDYNYCPEEIQRQHTWCEANGKKLYLLANSGCIPNCAFHTFHDNFVSHSKEIDPVSVDPDFQPYICRRLMEQEENRYLLLSGNLIRPEDLYRYEGLVDGIKLATRIHPFPAIVIRAYARRKFDGDLCTLTEPGFGDLLFPNMLDNAQIPDTYWQQKTTCLRAQSNGRMEFCRSCGYCSGLYKRILTKAK